MSIDRNFLGIRIDGDIKRGDRKDQKPQEEFEPLVQALLDDPLVDEFGWTQRTPYFNDGDACVFSAFGFWVRTASVTPEVDQEKLTALDNAKAAGALTAAEYRTARERIVQEDEDEDHEDLAISYTTHPVLGGMDGYRDNARYVGEHEETWRKAKVMDDAIDDGHFDDVLLNLFGDHCKVKVRRDGITVDFYEHD